MTGVSRPSALFAWLSALAYAGMIYALSSLPGSTPVLVNVTKFVSDKILHLLEYSFLGVLVLRAVGLSFRRLGPAGCIAWAFVISAAYAALDEWHQSFVPMRSASAVDWTMDAAGAWIGAWCYVNLAQKGWRRIRGI